MTEHHKQEQSNSDFAIALRARELINTPDKWCTGYRLNHAGQMCITGAILMALGAIPRDGENETNYDYNDVQSESLSRIISLLGWATYNDAETFNDSHFPGEGKAIEHERMLKRLDSGIQDWANADLTAKYKEPVE